MENGTSLDDILGSEPTGESAEPETIGQPRDEHGRFSAREETGETPAEEPQGEEVTPTSEQEPSHIPIAALKDERTKRQQAESQTQQALARLQQYEAYFQQMQNGAAQPEEEEDPIELIAQQVMSRLAPQNEMQMLTAKVEFAEQIARQKWDDYDEKVEYFKEAVRTNPFLLNELKSAQNPAEYAYNAANRILEAKQYGTAVPSREQLEAEIRQKIMAEIGMSNRQAPNSLATERSVGARSGPAWSGPTPLNELLG